MEKSPKISIITVCFNAGNALEKTIKSVISQSYPNLEYIIIDGKSTDNSLEIINKYSQYISIIISEPDSGLYDAMNKGLNLATGEYVNFMNAGDIFYNNEVTSNLIKEANLDYDVIYGDAIAINQNGQEHFESGGNNLEVLRKRPIYRHNASFTRLSLHKKFPFELSKYNEFGHALDFNHIYTIWRNGAKFQHINLPILKYDREGISNKPFKNIIYNFRISHQNRSAGIVEYIELSLDLIRAWKRKYLK